MCSETATTAAGAGAEGTAKASMAEGRRAWVAEARQRVARSWEGLLRGKRGPCGGEMGVWEGDGGRGGGQPQKDKKNPGLVSSLENHCTRQLVKQ